ncbi:hypothetical protein D3C86_1951080 [compost metagenome]
MAGMVNWYEPPGLRATETLVWPIAASSVPALRIDSGSKPGLSITTVWPAAPALRMAGTPVSAVMGAVAGAPVMAICESQPARAKATSSVGRRNLDMGEAPSVVGTL